MNIKKMGFTGLAMMAVLLFTSFVSAGEQLNIFILAGQSNMVGHARAHTIATLYASEKPRDVKLIQMVMANDKLSRGSSNRN